MGCREQNGGKVVPWQRKLGKIERGGSDEQAAIVGSTRDGRTHRACSTAASSLVALRVESAVTAGY